MVHLSAHLLLLGFAALGVLSLQPPAHGNCLKKGCFFSWVNPAVYPTSGGRCGEVDAAPRMPAEIFDNEYSVADYVELTLKLYNIDGAKLVQKRCDREGRLQHGNQSVTFAPPTLMKRICDLQCNCPYPNCPDVPDNAPKELYCSLCGPKFNAPIQVQFWVPKNSFVSAPQLRQARAYHTASPLGQTGRVLITGGQDNGFDPIATTEIYSPLSDSFAPGPPLASKRFYHSASPLPNGRVLIAGGKGDNKITGFIPLDTTEIYSPETNSFAPGPALAGKRYGHASSPLPDGRVLIVGGQDRYLDPLNTTEIYNPKTNSFAPGPRLATARYGLTASLLMDGRVLVAGGSDNRVIIRTTEIYNPKTNSFASGPLLGISRSFSAASTLPDGRVLIAGGVTGGDGGLATSEIYNPKTNSFAPGPGLTGTRYSIAASPLGGNGPEGVLITGGLPYEDPPLNTTEIYLFNNN